MKGMWTLRILALLLVLTSTLLSATTALAAQAAESDKFAQTLLENSRKHYVQALIAYNSGDFDSVAGLLQAAASNAKRVDIYLADLLLELHDCFPTQWSSVNFDTTSTVENIYNGYNNQYGWGYPMFGPGHAHWGYDPGDYSPS